MDVQIPLLSSLSLLQTPVSPHLLDLIRHAGPVAKGVLLVLLVFSFISWIIIVDKWRVFRAVKKEGELFRRLFLKHRPMREILQASKQLARNPFAAVFREAYWVFTQGNSRYANREALDVLREQKPDRKHAPEDLVRLFDSVATGEMLKLEKNLTFLATTGSVSPFFGLFGTVWGVMSAFMEIGFTGSADLSVVAPGISEALITTVAGLGAAIPAVMAYNYFVSQLKRLSSELEIFYSNLIEAFARAEAHEVK